MVTSHQRSERSSGAAVTPSGPAPTQLDDAVLAGARKVAAALAAPGGARSRDEWLEVVGDCQSLINTLTAVQDSAIAEAARRESIWCEDGTLGETVHAPGRVTLDAADVVAPLIGASHPQAQRRVEQAGRLAGGRVPVEADDRDVPEPSGLGGLHEAMATGHLDAYRAGVIAFELEVAPADVADAIVTALSGHFGDETSRLRQRTRVLLSRISSDLVRERAKRARASTGLRRWVAEPGVDEWHGTFPSEDAAAAWAAIDRLAHDLVTDGTCSNIEQARGKALTDLVTGNASIDVQVVLTVPADTGSAHPVTAGTTSGSTSPAALMGAPTSGHRAQDAVPGHPAATFVGVQVSGHDDDLVEVQGARPSEPLLVRRAWLRDHLTKRPPHQRRAAQRARPQFVPCDPLTGARLDAGDDLATDAYRPGAELAALVRARDGRCRFPGCSVAARFCDLDHVRPWPIGRTAAGNLLTLCRRHHRIKQRPGWRVRLAPDGSATWTDPCGWVRTTAPLDALQSLVLRADCAADGSLASTEPVRDIAATGALTHGPVASPGSEVPCTRPGEEPRKAEHRGWSALETHLGLRLEHHLAQTRQQPPVHDPRSHPTHRRCSSAADLRAGFSLRARRAPVPDVPPF